MCVCTHTYTHTYPIKFKYLNIFSKQYEKIETMRFYAFEKHVI